ncbi:MAG: hypothetical protein ACRDTV_09245, partial [Mycobacterium sp.]
MSARSRASQRENPATATRPIASNQSNGHRRQDGYAAPTVGDRADIDVLIAAAEHGFRLAVRC